MFGYVNSFVYFYVNCKYNWVNLTYIENTYCGKICLIFFCILNLKEAYSLGGYGHGYDGEDFNGKDQNNDNEIATNALHLAKSNGYKRERDCICRTIMTAKNSKNRLRKFCRCIWMKKFENI